jgi:transposase
VRALEDKGEVCFEEKVERLRRSGMSTDEIAQKMGVDLSWVESLVSMWEGGNPSGVGGERKEN